MIYPMIGIGVILLTAMQHFVLEIIIDKIDGNENNGMTNLYDFDILAYINCKDVVSNLKLEV